jgi:hypothetical protein
VKNAHQEPKTCQWSPGSECQLFPDYTNELFLHDGRSYCQFHLPLNSPSKLDANAFSARFSEVLGPRVGLRDFSGVAFPGRAPLGAVQYRVDVEAILRQCTFGPFVNFSLNGVGADLTKSRF